MKRVVNSLNTASKQLPASGPGILHVEIAPPYGEPTERRHVTHRLNRVKEVVARKLAGRQLTRINAVVMSCTYPHLPSGIAVNFGWAFHKNPRSALPAGFRVAGVKHGEADQKILIPEL